MSNVEGLFDTNGNGMATRVVGEPEERAKLFAKMSKVQNRVKTLVRSGEYKDNFSSYKYASERDVVEPISEAFSEEGVAIIPSVVGSWWHDLPSKNGSNRVVTVEIETVIGDSESGAYVIAGGRATAANRDKGTNAAFTTAFKYQLAKLAGVAFGDDGDDVNIEGADCTVSSEKPAIKNAAPIARPVSKEKRDTAQSIIKSEDKGEDAKAWLKENKVSFSKITNEQLGDLMTHLELA